MRNKEDDQGENLWDDPLVSNSDYEVVIRPRVIDRFIHLLIDLIAAFITYWLGYILLLFGQSFYLNQDISFSDATINVLNVFVCYLIITIISEGASGRTLGKVFTNYIVVKEDDSPIVFVDAIIRGVCKLIPFGFIGVFMRDDQRIVHDVLSKTKLILKKPMSSSEDDVIFDNTP